MPELPEVETIRLGLQKYLVGHTILRVAVRVPQLVSGDTDLLLGAKVIGIRRFGKGLVIDCDNDFSIAIHIKLTGQIIYQGPDVASHISPIRVKTLPNPFTHVIVDLDNDAKLYYTDVRRFGWIKILKTEEIENLPFFKGMGPEPFKDLTQEMFGEILSAAKTPIKPLLLDQKKIGGIGNIYANDSLWLAKIHPKRKADTLSREEVGCLYDALLTVLHKGLETGGASELNFVNALGEDGGYQKHFLAYAQQGKPCQRCGTTMEKIQFSGRGTYFCPNCQKEA